MVELDKIKNLPPEERIKKLKELEEERKKEIKTAEDLIEESKNEIEEKERIRKEFPIDQMKAMNVEELFSQAEKQMFKSKHGNQIKEPKKVIKKKEELLEHTLAQEQLNHTINEARNDQIYSLSRTPIQDLADQAYSINQRANEVGGFQNLDYQTRQMAFETHYALIEKQKSFINGDYPNASQYLSNKTNAAERMLDDLTGIRAYKRH